jgi:hypothetical protein
MVSTDAISFPNIFSLLLVESMGTWIVGEEESVFTE